MTAEDRSYTRIFSLVLITALIFALWLVMMIGRERLFANLQRFFI